MSDQDILFLYELKAKIQVEKEKQAIRRLSADLERECLTYINQSQNLEKQNEKARQRLEKEKVMIGIMSAILMRYFLFVLLYRNCCAYCYLPRVMWL